MHLSRTPLRTNKFSTREMEPKKAREGPSDGPGLPTCSEARGGRAKIPMRAGLRVTPTHPEAILSIGPGIGKDARDRQQGVPEKNEFGRTHVRLDPWCGGAEDCRGESGWPGLEDAGPWVPESRFRTTPFPQGEWGSRPSDRARRRHWYSQSPWRKPLPPEADRKSTR